MNKRLESLDALRGFIIICLVVLERFVYKMYRINGTWWREWSYALFRHRDWEGFSTWDMVMPLFLFITGVAIPYSLAKYKCYYGNSHSLYFRLFRRFCLLWLLGIICHGNLLAFDINSISFFSSPLQAIAIGYVVSVVLFLRTRWKAQIVIAIFLLFTYWGAMEFCSLGIYGNGNYSEHGNLAEGVDMLVLGQFRDTAHVVDGKIIVDPTYTYTWILSSLNFVVTVLSGMLVGQVLKSEKTPQMKLTIICLSGFLMVAIGLLMGLIHPIIKHIWTSSMVLVSSGYCFLLMGLFYYVIDYCGWNKHLTLLKIYGMTSITAYVISLVVDFSSVSNSLLYGLETVMGEHYYMILMLGNVMIVFLILLFLYKNKVLIRV